MAIRRSSLLLGLGLLATPLAAQWNRGDRLALGAAGVGIWADCGTTIAGLHRAGVVERNPFLGQRPGTLGVVSGCLLVSVGSWALADALPRPWRRRLLWGLAIVGTANALHNLSQGR